MAQHSNIARSAIMSNAATPESSTPGPGFNGNSPNGHGTGNGNGNGHGSQNAGNKDASLVPPSRNPAGRPNNVMPSDTNRRNSKDGVGIALSDTPMSTAPSSPQM